MVLITLSDNINLPKYTKLEIYCLTLKDKLVSKFTQSSFAIASFVRLSGPFICCIWVATLLEICR